MLRSQNIGEEIANSISHGIGALLALAALEPLLHVASTRGGAAEITGASLFAASMFVLYLASTLYHAFPQGRIKKVFRVLDHNAIFLLIAGTYTPFTLGVLRGAWGWSLFGVVWGIALLGILFTSFGGIKYKRFSLALYLLMGWLIVIAIRPLWLSVPLPGLVWLLCGGLAYSVGVAFYTAKKLPYAHFVWHIFILLGTACHFVAVLGYAF